LRRRIEPGWRYNAAQWCLKLLFGRPWHLISPWPMAGPGAAAVIFYQGKVLLHQRRGKIEQPGKWGCNGGYLDLNLEETFNQGLAREVFEETGLRFVPESFGTPIWVAMFYHQQKYEMADHAGVGCWYAAEAPEDLLPLLQETDEAHNFRWVSEAEVATLKACSELASEETAEALRRAFAQAKIGSLPRLVLAD
jgi:ADP-ribose pyrophosphatase YjhB (NUDIX family)